MKTALSQSSLLHGTLILCFLLLSVSGIGQVEYTDIAPDKYLNRNTEYNIDIDKDSVTDFVFKFEYSYYAETYDYIFKIFCKNSSQVAVTDDKVSVVNNGGIIDHNLSWSNQTEVLLLYYNDGGYWEEGNWIDVTDGFVGLRIKNGDHYKYAWLRIYIINNRAMYLADFGIHLEFDSAIIAGEGIPIAATSLFLKDVDDYFDGRDLEVSFTKAFDESPYSDYRIIISKANDSSAYDLDEMNQVQETRYVEIAVDSLDDSHTVTVKLAQDAVDKDGDSFAPLVEYRAHLLNVNKSGIASENVLSSSSPALLLQAFSEAVKNPVGYDNGNNNDAGDISVSFHMAAREAFISEYRIFILQPEEINDFDVNTALSLSPDFYSVYIPDSNHIDILINPNQLDVNGNALTEGIAYHAIVLSVADGVYSISSSLSKPSRKFILKNPDDLKAGQSEGEDIIYHEFDTAIEFDYYGGYHYHEFDMDGDSITDFVFEGHYFEGNMYQEYSLFVIPERNNKVLLCDHEEYDNWTGLLYYNHQISGDYRWLNNESILMDYDWDATVGLRHDWGHLRHYHNTDLQLGLCLMDNEIPIYGWITINSADLSALIIKKYGYFDAANTISGNRGQAKINLYPNPAKDYILLEKNNPALSNSEVRVKIYNSQGAIKDEFSFGGSEYKLELSDYPSGIYFCVSSTDVEDLQTIKFVVD